MGWDSNIRFAKTALLNRWEIVRVGKDGSISKHIKEYPISSPEFGELFKDFAEYKLNEIGEFTLRFKDIKITVEKVEQILTEKRMEENKMI